MVFAAVFVAVFVTVVIAFRVVFIAFPGFVAEAGAVLSAVERATRAA
jgi:hypothetical protein